MVMKYQCRVSGSNLYCNGFEEVLNGMEDEVFVVLYRSKTAFLTFSHAVAIKKTRWGLALFDSAL